LAWADRIEGNYRGALAKLQQAAALAPTDPGTYLLVSQTHNALGEYDQALAAVNKGLGLSLVPSWLLDAHYELRGNIYLMQKKYALALLDYNKACEVDPQANIDVSFHSQRALAHFHLGQYEQALADIARAVELRPDRSTYIVWIPEDLVA